MQSAHLPPGLHGLLCAEECVADPVPGRHARTGRGMIWGFEDQLALRICRRCRMLGWQDRRSPEY